MFDIGFWEIGVIATIMLIVLGPERLPGVARTCGLWLGKFRRMVADVKSEIKREVDAAELKDLKEVTDQIKESQEAITNTIHSKTDKIRSQLNQNALEPDNASPDAKQSNASEPISHQSDQANTPSNAKPDESVVANSSTVNNESTSTSESNNKSIT